MGGSSDGEQRRRRRRRRQKKQRLSSAAPAIVRHRRSPCSLLRVQAVRTEGQARSPRTPGPARCTLACSLALPKPRCRQRSRSCKLPGPSGRCAECVVRRRKCAACSPEQAPRTPLCGNKHVDTLMALPKLAADASLPPDPSCRCLARELGECCTNVSSIDPCSVRQNASNVIQWRYSDVGPPRRAMPRSQRRRLACPRSLKCAVNVCQPAASSFRPPCHPAPSEGCPPAASVADVVQCMSQLGACTARAGVGSLPINQLFADPVKGGWPLAHSLAAAANQCSDSHSPGPTGLLPRTSPPCPAGPAAAPGCSRPSP